MTANAMNCAAVGEFDIPICAVDPCFVDGKGRTSRLPSQLLDTAPVIDECAAYSVLQYGAILPPRSPWRGIHRLLPGFRYENLHRENSIPNGCCPASFDSFANDVPGQAAIIEEAVDAALREALVDDCRPILLFSGGVDSGFLASRLRALGCRDALLLNASFSDDDPESALAKQMAQSLGFAFEELRIPITSLKVLEQPGKVYSQPFGDASTAHAAAITNELSQRLRGEHRVIIDGTGADGAFGMLGKARRWRQIYRLPAIVRRAAQAVYQRSLWCRTNSLESVIRPAARAATLSLPAATIAQNGLAESLYACPPCGAQLDKDLSEWLSDAGLDGSNTLIVAADLAVTCANVFAQKCKDPLEQAGHRVAFPFLDKRVTDISLRAAEAWEHFEPKAPLKHSLAQHVPREMVYRAKSAFVDPKATLFGEPGFCEMLRATIDPAAPLAALLVADRVAEACWLLKKRVSLPPQTLNLLWAAVFTDRWYRTALPA